MTTALSSNRAPKVLSEQRAQTEEFLAELQLKNTRATIVYQLSKEALSELNALQTQKSNNTGDLEGMKDFLSRHFEEYKKLFSVKENDLKVTTTEKEKVLKGVEFMKGFDEINSLAIGQLAHVVLEKIHSFLKG